VHRSKRRFRAPFYLQGISAHSGSVKFSFIDAPIDLVVFSNVKTMVSTHACRDHQLSDAFTGCGISLSGNRR
jgi:hypothetical protein